MMLILSLESLRKGTALLALTSLSACSSIYSDTFECKAGKGLACKSISEVNAMVSRGEVGLFPEPDGAKPSTSEQKEAAPLPAFQETRTPSPPGGGGMVRVPEQTLRVWLAPHLEDSGTWSGAHYVYTVVTPGRWVSERPLIKNTPESQNVSTHLKRLPS